MSSTQVFADNDKCANYINNHLFGGKNLFFQVDKNLKLQDIPNFVNQSEPKLVKEKLGIKNVFKKRSTHTEQTITSKYPPINIVINRDIEGKLVNISYSDEKIPFLKSGAVGGAKQIIGVDFDYSASGSCYPQKRTPKFSELENHPNKSAFDTAACRELYNVFKKNPSLKICNDSELNKQLATILGHHGQDEKCSLCGSGVWKESIDKTIVTNTISRSQTILDHCSHNGLDPFVIDDSFWVDTGVIKNSISTPTNGNQQ